MIQQEPQFTHCTNFEEKGCLQSPPKLSSIFSFQYIVLIGNKADLEDQKQVDENEARNLAETLGLKYFETSALSGQNVSESVEALLDQVRTNNYSSVKKGFPVVFVV